MIPHFFKEHGGPSMPCTYGFGEVLEGWILYQIGEL